MLPIFVSATPVGSGDHEHAQLEDQQMIWKTTTSPPPLELGGDFYPPYWFDLIKTEQIRTDDPHQTGWPPIQEEEEE